MGDSSGSSTMEKLGVSRCPKASRPATQNQNPDTWKLENPRFRVSGLGFRLQG